MGGVKKKPISRLEKRMFSDLQIKTQRVEKIIRREVTDPELINEIIKECRRAKVITPTSLALKFNLKVSAAKRLLKNLEREGAVKLVDKCSKIRIYTGVAG